MRKIQFIILALILIMTACASPMRVIDEQYTKDTIQNQIRNRAGVFEPTWSPNGKYLAFAEQDIDILYYLNLWKVGNKEASRIQVKGNLHGIKWSPDSKFFTINDGTSISKATYVVDPQSRTVLDAVQNAGGPIWSPDSKKVLFSVENKTQPSIPVELEGTLDLAVYDINKKALEVIEVADRDFYYVPLDWTKDNIIRYQKKYFNSDEVEILEHKYNIRD